MPKVYLLKGLPGSGKSTWAREYINQKNQYKTVRVNKDDLRAMLHNSWHSRGNENFVLRVRNYIVTEALMAGHDVIVDDTNFSPEHEKTIRTIADTFKADFEIKFFDTPLTECIRRDALREKPVGEKVIRSMRKQWGGQFPKPLAKRTPVTGLQKAIICDLDGTLALIGDRNPYESDKCSVDDLNQPIFDIVERFYDGGYKILLFSGRDGSTRKFTEEWLKKNQVPYDQLVMREAGDKRKDALIKEEMYKQHVDGKYNVSFVLDDRNQVVEMWRSIGLTCLQVEYGDF